MTRDELRSKAVRMRCLYLGRDQYTGQPKVFGEIEHYFNEQDGEIGLVWFPMDSVLENVHLFDPPRVWSSDFLNNCIIKEM